MGRARKASVDIIRQVKGLSRNGGMRRPSWVALVDRFPPPPIPRQDRDKLPIITFPQDRLAELYMKNRKGLVDGETAYEFADEQLTLIENGIPEEDAYNMLMEKYDKVEAHRFLDKFAKMRGIEFAPPEEYDDIENEWVEAESRAIKEAMRLEHEEEEALRQMLAESRKTPLDPPRVGICSRVLRHVKAKDAAASSLEDNPMILVIALMVILNRSVHFTSKNTFDRATPQQMDSEFLLQLQHNSLHIGIFRFLFFPQQFSFHAAFMRFIWQVFCMHTLSAYMHSPVLVEQLNTVLDRFEALEAILVCTSEGVPLLKVMADEEKATLAYDYADTVLPTVFAGAAEQIGKLKFGAVQTVTSFFDNVVLIHINNAPLVITLVASNSAHIGALQALARELRPALSPLKKAVESADVH
ncbi:hypothetical protein FI667_g511, partial [Globisporangium splendens]